MAADYFVIPRNGRTELAKRAIDAANRLKELRELVDGLNDIAQHQFNGADHTMLEAAFTLPAGTGANFITLLGLINNILNTTGTVAGTDRISQMEEFQARLSGQ